jgi:hypothetical protein
MIRRHIVALSLGLMLLPLAAGAQDTDMSGQIEQSSETSPEEMIRFTDMAVQEMKAAVGEVADMLEAAEREGAMVAIQCLSRKLTTMRALAEVSENAALELQQALADGENDRAQHEFRKITVALSRLRQFRAEADTCGGGGGESGETKVKVSSSAVSSGDETNPPEIDIPFGEAPPDTSQFR